MQTDNSAKKYTICRIKEVQNLFSPSIAQSTACNYINQCKQALKKDKHQFLTLEEFTEYFGLNG